MTAKAKFLDAYIEFARQRIRAPASGYVAKRKAQVGDRVRPGDQILVIVPLEGKRGGRPTSQIFGR
jgi:membrane fusion protein (multidrug efflux system)